MHGIEVISEIGTHIIERMAKMGVTVETRVGRSSQIPCEDGCFDHALACNSCYCVDAGQQFSDNLKKVSRVMKSGGLFIYSLPMG